MIFASVAMAWTGAAAVYAIGVAVRTTDAFLLTLGLGTFLGAFLSLATVVNASKSPLTVNLREKSLILKFRSKQIEVDMSDVAEISGKGLKKRDGTRVRCIWMDKIILHELNRSLAEYRELESKSPGKGK